MFHDANGKLSSKRILAFSLTILAVVGGTWGAFANNPMLVDFAKWLIVSGVGAAVAGVAERTKV